MLPIVVIESPYAGDAEEVKANREYAIKAMKDCFNRQEIPIASHIFYTEALDDTNPVERTLGIDAGLTLAKFAHKTVVYTDRGISTGMDMGIRDAEVAGRPVEYRSLA